MRISACLMLLKVLPALLLAGCGGGNEGARAGAAIRIDYIADNGLGDRDLEGLRPAIVGATQLGLTTLDASGQVSPSLASSWRVSDDGLSYVFKLREAYWVDGRRLTAGDVVAVMRRLVAPGSRSPVKPMLMVIENAPAIAANRKPGRMLGVNDPRHDTVVITLTKPEPALLQILAHPASAIVRRDDPPPASGPFVVASKSDEGLVNLKKNQSYYDAGAVDLGGAEIGEFGIDEALRRFAAGETDIVTGGRLGGIRQVRERGNSASLRLEPSWGLYFYLARTSGGPMADIRIRRALAMSIDRRGILTRMFGIAGLQPAFGVLPPTLADAFAGSNADWAQWTFQARQAEAARLLAEAGYGMARPLEIKVAMPRPREHSDLLQALTAYWGAIGVRVKAYTRSPEGHREAIREGNFDLALMERIAPAPSPDFFLRPFTCAERLGGYCNPAVDKLLEQASTEDDPGTRIQLQRRASRLISEDAPLIAILSPVRWSLVSSRVHGWEDNIAGAHPLSSLTLVGESHNHTES